MPQINVQVSMASGSTHDCSLDYATLATVQRNWAALFLARPVPSVHSISRYPVRRRA
jgi:hypothetical protein